MFESIKSREIKKACEMIFENSGNLMYNQMWKSLSNQISLRFPRAPFATLIWILSCCRIPTEIEFELLLEMMDENVIVKSLSEEVDDLTLSENINESMNEISPKGEVNANKKKQKSFSKNTISAGKTFKSDAEAGVGNCQADLTSFTGRKFEDQNRNNNCYINSALNGLLALEKYREKLNCREKSWIVTFADFYQTLILMLSNW